MKLKSLSKKELKAINGGSFWRDVGRAIGRFLDSGNGQRGCTCEPDYIHDFDGWTTVSN